MKLLCFFQKSQTSLHLICENVVEINSHTDCSYGSGGFLSEGSGASLVFICDEVPFLAEADVEVLVARVDNNLCLAAFLIVEGEDNGSVS